jgi:glycosyltransferase involved in cell wall biosynthesis
MVTRLLNLAGCFVGAPDEMMQGMPDNPRGYWERNDVCEANTKALHASGVDWNTTLGDEFATLGPARRRKVVHGFRDVVQELEEHRPWAIKDPRLSVLLPLWKPLLVDPVVVVCHRHPLEVARSLRSRGGMPMSIGVALWEVYTLAVLENTRGMTRILVSHEDLLGSPVETAKDLVARLKQVDPSGIKMPTKAKIGTLIDGKLHRSKTSDEQAAEYLGRSQFRLLDDLNEGRRLDEWGLADLSESSRDLIVYYREAAAAGIERRSQERSAVTELIESFGVERDRTAAELQQVHTRLADLGSRHEVVTNERAELGEQLQTNEADRARLTDELRESEAEVRELAGRLTQAHEDMEKLGALLEQANEGRESAVSKLQELYESNQEIGTKLESTNAEARAAAEKTRDALQKAHELEQRSGELERELASVRIDGARLERELASVRIDGARLEAELAAAHEKATDVGRLLESSIAETGRIGVELRGAHRETGELRDRLAVVVGEKTDLENELVAARGEVDGLVGEIDELSQTKDWLYENWQENVRRLEAIHQSKMWRLWMLWIPLRRILISPLTLLRSIPRLARGGMSRIAKFLGWCYLGIRSTAMSARARMRQSSSKTHRPDTEHGGPGLEGARPKVLIVMPYHLYPPNHGGGVRLFNLVKLLSESCDLHVLAFSRTGEDPEQREALAPYCESVHFHHWFPRHRPDRFGIRPPNAQIFWSERAVDQIREIVHEHGIDIVQLEYTELGQYAEIVPDDVAVILTEHDVAFRTQRRRRALRFMDRYPDSKAYGASRSDLWRLLVHEIEVCRESDSIHSMSEVDRDYLASFLPGDGRKIRVAPNGVSCDELAPPDDNPPRKDVLYVGNFQNLPNMDALEYLVEDVWPILRIRCPSARLTVVGAHAEGNVTHYDGAQGVHVVGEVPEVASYYHRHRVLAVPIRAGSGTRLKILEAFAAGIPVVSTTHGAAGREYEAGRHHLIADDAVSFSAAVETLLTDDELAERLAREGMELARAKYDWKWVAAAIEADYAELIKKPRSAGA